MLNEIISQILTKLVIDSITGVITNVANKANIITNALKTPKWVMGGKLDIAITLKPMARATEVDKIGVASFLTVFSKISLPLIFFFIS